ncbi:MAG: hypothetical protein K2X35_14280 [Bryobacteraceae bacterium]|nr:hypothetical protein [Bryobacteraceae bacterium]
MQIHDRDRRALLLLAAAVVFVLLFQLFTSEPETAPQMAEQPVELLEQKLDRLRQEVAAAPAKNEILKQVRAELTLREKGLIAADTAAQAQAQLLQTMRRVARAENPPVEIGATEVGQVKPFGDAYGEVAVAVNMQCRIEQLVNIVAALSAQPEIMALNEMRVLSPGNKEKTLNVRLSLSGVVARKLVPDKKSGGEL